MQDYDDEPVQRPKWLGWVIIIGMILVVLGLLNLGLRLTFGTQSDQEAASKLAAVTQQNPALQEGKAQIDNSDCMRCHGVDRDFVGPSFERVADKYRTMDNAPSYIADKIRNGSVGVWGRVIMPRHPQVTQEQAEQMAAWLLALKSPESAAATPAN